VNPTTHSQFRAFPADCPHWTGFHCSCQHLHIRVWHERVPSDTRGSQHIASCTPQHRCCGGQTLAR